MEITKELINEATQYEFHSFDTLDEMYVVILDGKILSPNNSCTFHDSYDSAWKHFYRECNWRIKGIYRKAYADSIGAKDYWSCKADKTDRQIWEEFKAQIFDNYGFKIVKWKDAKGDVCGQNRA